MKLRPSLALFLALAVTGVGVHAQSAADLTDAASPRKFSTLPLKPTVTQAQAAQLSARFLTRFHYDAKPLDDAMSQKIFKAYIDSLDGEKVFFTQADLTKFAPLKTQMDDAIWNQDLSGPFSMFNLYITRAIDRMNYARGLLVKGFDFSTSETYNYDRKKAEWPKDQAELDTLWRQRTMNDWL